jgi:hypothetical protein
MDGGVQDSMQEGTEEGDDDECGGDDVDHQVTAAEGYQKGGEVGGGGSAQDRDDVGLRASSPLQGDSSHIAEAGPHARPLAGSSTPVAPITPHPGPRLPSGQVGPAAADVATAQGAVHPQNQPQSTADGSAPATVSISGTCRLALLPSGQVSGHVIDEETHRACGVMGVRVRASAAGCMRPTSCQVSSAPVCLCHSTLRFEWLYTAQ